MVENDFSQESLQLLIGIGDKLVEINCVSPGGIPRINRLDDTRHEIRVIDFIERKVKQVKM